MSCTYLTICDIILVVLEHVSDTGKVYYHHKATNSTQWDKPLVDGNDENAETRQHETELQPGWEGNSARRV